MQLYQVNSEPRCETISPQFPNIFRIITTSLHELLKAIPKKEFSINTQIATVYFHADCCFFEELPRATNLDRLRDAIKRQISEKYITHDSIYIQYNKDAANAVVLTCNEYRIWSLHNSILLDERSFIKKDNLACRLLIKKVPKTISSELICKHKIFGGAVVKTLRTDDNIILELSDRTIYEECIDRGALRIEDDVLGIGIYTFSNSPEDSYIDTENWYEAEMCNHKPDIMPFIANPHHPIFRYKWNSSAFQQQLRSWTSTEHSNSKIDSEKFEKECNTKRHLLRMTVMLNTIGVIRRGFYRVENKEIKLKPDQLKTIMYNHKSKLQGTKRVPVSQMTEFAYSSTSVHVINEDCLVLYEKLVNDHYRPVLLNMANATTPGGGYKRGDGAQEETIFRRSNYYQSLDLELDDDKPSSRFSCNSSCDLELFDERDRLYPMDEFGAIYTSGFTIVRHGEKTGYAFMDVQIYDVCAIAMAAYRDPKSDDDKLLNDKFSIGTRKKIENIFAIAYHHKHDSLVVSALGCGAFRNPPKHLAKIFKSVIEQYAGYFKSIYFAIVDDHNAGQDLNPTGNYRPFKEILDNISVQPRHHQMVDMMVGPWRILNRAYNKEIVFSDIRICYLDPCHFGGKCHDLKNEQHCREYSHPPLCPHADGWKSCNEKHDNQHMLWFRHRQKCSYGGECNLIDNIPIHSNEFEHPEYCHNGGRCEDMSDNHLRSYRHLPLCKFRRQCVDYNGGSYEHCRKFRHCVPKCRFGYFCL